jgi:hypothetical protein
MLFTTKQKTNPYEFNLMERWESKDEFRAFIGYSKDGNIYLTSDHRKGIPVFSNGCRVGETVTREDFDLFRSLYLNSEDKSISKIDVSDYYIIGFKDLFAFGNSEPIDNSVRRKTLILAFLNLF